MSKRKRRTRTIGVRSKPITFATPRVAGEIYTLKLRRLLPLRDGDARAIHRWIASKLKGTKRRLAFVQIVLRSLGHIYETKLIDENAQWVDNLHNCPVIPSDKSRKAWAAALWASVAKRLDRIELLNEGKVIWTKAFRLNLYDASPGASVPSSPNR